MKMNSNPFLSNCYFNDRKSGSSIKMIRPLSDLQRTEDGYEIYPLPQTLDGYACINGETLWLSLIRSKYEGKGNFRRFLDEVEQKFKIIKVPTPSNRMRKILEIRGYILLKEYFPEPMGEIGEVMIWSKPL